MAIKLKCLGARPKGKHPVIILEMYNKKANPGDIIDGKDLTYAAMICEKYPGCFEIIEEVDPPKIEEKQVKKSYKDKVLPVYSEKEFL